MKNIEKFIEVSSVDYHDTEQTDEHESEHNLGNKKLWGALGVKALKAMAGMAGGVAINIRHNPSGSIDRGYVSGFISSVDGTKTVYVSINDGMSDVLYRTAKNPADFTGGSNNTEGITGQGFARLFHFVENNLETK